MAKTNILVTGATGYIGSNFVKTYCDSYHLIIVTRKNSNLAQFNSIKDKIDIIDVTSLESDLRDKKIDLVLHLATNYQKQTEPKDYERLVNDNVLFGIKILDFMQKHKIKKIINADSFISFDEEGNFLPANYYAATKRAFKDFLTFFVKKEELSALNLVLFDSYGEGDNRDKIFNILKQKIANNEQSFATSKGEQIVHFTYIQDVISGLDQAVKLLLNENKPGLKQYFIASKGEKLKEIINLFKEISKSSIQINFGEIPYSKGQIMKPYIGEILPNWQAKTSLKDGIKRILAA